MDARATYEAGVARTDERARALEATSRTLSAARLVVAFAALGLVAWMVWGHLPSAVWGAVGLLVVGFIGLVVVHARAFAATERARQTLLFHKRGLARLGNEWRAFASNGAGRAPASHPYADDLDVFGPSSLFQLIDATETPFGQDVLAGWLANTSPSGASWATDLVERQAAVRDVGERAEWRENLAVEGALLRADAPDPKPFLAWAEGALPLEVPIAVVLSARVLPLLVLAAWLGGRYLAWPRWTWLAVVGLELLVATPYRARASRIAETVAGQLGGFARYGALFSAAAAASEKRGSSRIAALVSRLAGPDKSVAREMRSLERIVSFIEARNNEVFRLFLGPVLMWDLNLVVLVERWRRRVGGEVRGWFHTLGELEAFASLGGFAFNRPDHAWPKLTDDAQLGAVGLGHPLIDERRRVGNDVALPREGTALIVTGSNMSGKSTLLRALGVNAVLAQAGAPVCARSFTMGRVTLATSMRIRDSLDEGVSHFYAELQKLKRVVDLARTQPPLFFLLDEILHGTNSRERIIGARAVITDLIGHRALGAVSTHDLGIASLGEPDSDRIVNVHFEEQVADDGTMTFDYHLRHGLVQSSNALRLMRAIGLDVPVDPSVESGPASTVPGGTSAVPEALTPGASS